MKEKRDVPAKERRTGDSGGGDDDQPLVCRHVLPKGVGESNQHGEIKGIHEGDNEKTKDRLGVRDSLKPRCQIRGGSTAMTRNSLTLGRPIRNNLCFSARSVPL